MLTARNLSYSNFFDSDNIFKIYLFFRIRDANLASRGIDPNDTEKQIQAVEDRGKELLKDYMDKKKEGPITREESESILAPMKGAFQLMENALNMAGKESKNNNSIKKLQSQLRNSFYLSDGKLDPFVSVEHKPKKYNTITSKTTLSAIGGDCASYLIGDEPTQPSNQNERKMSNEGKIVGISNESKIEEITTERKVEDHESDFVMVQQEDVTGAEAINKQEIDKPIVSQLELLEDIDEPTMSQLKMLEEDTTKKVENEENNKAIKTDVSCESSPTLDNQINKTNVIDENKSNEKVEDPVNEPGKISGSKDVTNVGTASGGIINNEIFLDVNTYKEVVDVEVDKKTKQMCLPDTEGKSLITYTSPGVFYEKDVDGNDTFSNAKAIKRFMDWEDKMLREMTESQESEDDEKNNKLSIEDVTGAENKKESETIEGEKAIDQKELDQKEQVQNATEQNESEHTEPEATKPEKQEKEEKSMDSLIWSPCSNLPCRTKSKIKEVKKYNDPIETQTDFDEPIDMPSKLREDTKIQPGKSQGLLKMGPARQITYIKTIEEPDFSERDKAELISIEKSINKLKAEKGEEDKDGKENEEKKVYSRQLFVPCQK